NMSIVFFTVSLICIWKFWSENYGNKDAKATHSLILAIQILRADPRIVVLGLCIASFEASLFLFIMNWTPVLERTRSSTDQNPLPLGFIFAGYMVVAMIGSFVFYFLSKWIRVQSYMIEALLLTAVGMTIPIIFPNSLIAVLIGFILFEFCGGIYTPSITVFKNAYIPNEIAMLCMIILRGLKIPEEQAYVNETEILLEKSSSPLSEMEQPLNRSSSSTSLTLEHSTKSKEDN
ncbi:unnamed protein product, partial [Adineta steineri]